MRIDEAIEMRRNLSEVFCFRSLECAVVILRSQPKVGLKIRVSLVRFRDWAPIFSITWTSSADSPNAFGCPLGAHEQI